MPNPISAVKEEVVMYGKHLGLRKNKLNLSAIASLLLVVCVCVCLLLAGYSATIRREGDREFCLYSQPPKFPHASLVIK